MKKCPKCGFFLDDAAEKCTNCDFAFVEQAIVKEQKSMRTIKLVKRGIRTLNRIAYLFSFLLMFSTIVLPWGVVLTVPVSMWDILSSAIPNGPGAIWKFVTQGGYDALSPTERALILGFIGSIFFTAALLGALAGAVIGGEKKLTEISWFFFPGIYGILCVIALFFYFQGLFSEFEFFSFGLGIVVFLVASLILIVNDLIAIIAE
ncbi:MAG: hypothetical protein QXX08_09490 [Candidatus Bathyarchaeia archaeon]